MNEDEQQAGMVLNQYRWRPLKIWQTKILKDATLLSIGLGFPQIFNSLLYTVYIFSPNLKTLWGYIYIYVKIFFL